MTTNWLAEGRSHSKKWMRSCISIGQILRKAKSMLKSFKLVYYVYAPKKNKGI